MLRLTFLNCHPNYVCKVCIFVFLTAGEFGEAHEFSLYFMLPFIGVSLALLQLNWFVVVSLSLI